MLAMHAFLEVHSYAGPFRHSNVTVAAEVYAESPTLINCHNSVFDEQFTHNFMATNHEC